MCLEAVTTKMLKENLGIGAEAQLVEPFPSMHEAAGSTPSRYETRHGGACL